MWSARWGHTAVVYNDTAPRDDFPMESPLSNPDAPSNSKRLEDMSSYLLVMGGDDRVLDGHGFDEEEAKMGQFGKVQADGAVGGPTAHGTFLNDVWWSEPPVGSQAQCK